MGIGCQPVGHFRIFAFLLTELLDMPQGQIHLACFFLIPPSFNRTKFLSIGGNAETST